MGQKNTITRRWAKRVTRPSAPQDQRTKGAARHCPRTHGAHRLAFGAMCPKSGKGLGLVVPSADTHAMTLHLADISQAVDHGADAAIIFDQAGWHISKSLAVPDNITLLPLPPRSPKLNPAENIWQIMRDTWRSNQVVAGYGDFLAVCFEAWDRLVGQPWRIMTIGMRARAHGF
ncbi:MAG: transposase [Pseudomonadota bacterium]